MISNIKFTIVCLNFCKIEGSLSFAFFEVVMIIGVTPDCTNVGKEGKNGGIV